MFVYIWLRCERYIICNISTRSGISDIILIVNLVQIESTVMKVIITVTLYPEIEN